MRIDNHYDEYHIVLDEFHFELGINENQISLTAYLQDEKEDSVDLITLEEIQLGSPEAKLPIEWNYDGCWRTYVESIFSTLENSRKAVIDSFEKRLRLKVITS
jgi:hypothetical protein